MSEGSGTDGSTGADTFGADAESTDTSGTDSGDADTDDTDTDTDGTDTEGAESGICGDGVLQEDEECDAGMANGPGNACTDECIANVCGDGVLGPGEGCDDGNGIDADACTNACAVAPCGDGVIAEGETCDDANAVDTDACLSTCVMASCGDGFVFDGQEECDNAQFNSDNALCTASCVVAMCGDGLVLLDGEDCDAGMANGPGNACTDECMANVCGDGVLGPGEGCDDGNGIDGDDCTNACAPVSCGDGVLAQGEGCDDGNVLDNDACLSTCAVASCGDGFVFNGQEECDNAEFNSDSAMCTADCVDATCGDGFVWLGVEDCDDANMVDFDWCSNECLEPTPELHLSFSQIKQFEFSWAPVFGAQYYRLFESKDNGEPFVQVGGNIIGESIALTMPLHLRLNASYKLLACNEQDCSESAIVDVVGTLAEAVGYFKASNTNTSDGFGASVALSQDGNTLVVGAPGESSNALGINGNQPDNSAVVAGAVYVFVRSNGNWSQQAYIKASNTEASDQFGWDMALSANGNTLVVSAWYEDGSASGINGNQANNSAPNAGAVYVFIRSGVVWSQQAYIKASNPGQTDHFGVSVALSGDGNTLAVGADREDSAAMGVNGNQADESLEFAGAVYVFVRNGGVWSQQAYVKASSPGWREYFGRSVALSGDGNTLAVGASDEDSNATGINGNQADNSADYAGAVYVLVRNGGAWSQQAYVKASNTNGGDYFGSSVALSGDGNTLAVGALKEDSNATGINGNQDDNSAAGAGAVYVFIRNGGNWSQQAYIKSSNSGANDWFGDSVDLSEDGNTLAVNAFWEDSNALGLNSLQGNDSAPDAGAVYVFGRDGGVWSQRAYVKAPNTNTDDEFGYGVALSGDANTLAVGAHGEAGNAMGINGNQADNSATNAGAVYLY